MNNTKRIGFKFNLVHFFSYRFHSSESEQTYSELLDSSSANHVVGPLHARVTKSGTSQNLHLANRLLPLYFNSGNAKEAQKAFDEIIQKDVRTWTVLILGYGRIRSPVKALHLFSEMLSEGILPNKFTLSVVLKCCISMCQLQAGNSIHGWVIRNNVDCDVILGNSLLNLYSKCNVLEYAERAFQLMHNKDTVSWNIMIDALVRNGDIKRALFIFQSVPFKDVSSWNTIISGQVKNGSKLAALKLLHRMGTDGPVFNERTLSIALNVVSSLSVLRFGKQIHARILISGMGNDVFVRDSLIDMYCKCRDLAKADILFRARNSEICSADMMAETVSWSSIVSGYVQSGSWEEGLEVFRNMIHQEVSIDAFTLSSVASLCACVENLDLGQQIHVYVEKMGYGRDVFLSSSLVDMYCKCGCFDDARVVFDTACDKNVVLWTSMIYGYGLHGQGGEAICLFNSMLRQGIRPNEVSFLGVLTACSHAGLLDEGWNYFTLMKKGYNIKPKIGHLTCIVDLFGRSACFKEIKDFIYKNNISDSGAVWSALLSACKIHMNVEVARWAAENLVRIELSKPEPYLLLSSIYATDNRWDEADNARLLMRKRGNKKITGQSWIELKNHVDSFVGGDVYL